jgi:hypothetical protein
VGITGGPGKRERLPALWDPLAPDRGLPMPDDAKPTDEITERLNKALGEFVSSVRISTRLSHTAVVVTAAAILEDVLEQCLKKKMRPLKSSKERRLFAAYGPISTFAAKIDLAYAFDITTDDIDRELQLIRKIRNAFSHSKETRSLDEEPIKSLFYALKRPAGASGTYPAQFMACVQVLANYLDAYLAPLK